MGVGKVGLAPGEGLAPRTHEVGAGATRAGGGGGAPVRAGNGGLVA